LRGRPGDPFQVSPADHYGDLPLEPGAAEHEAAVGAVTQALEKPGAQRVLEQRVVARSSVRWVERNPSMAGRARPQKRAAGFATAFKLRFDNTPREDRKRHGW
jgi:hypothetical protein